MAGERKEVKCPWCEERVATSDIKIKRDKNDHGTVIERRCPKCSKVLAAYLEEEGEFLSKVRTF